MSVCVMCGVEAGEAEVLASFDENAFGIPVTIRHGVIRHTCRSCGFEGIEIPDAEGLAAAVAVARILRPDVLLGPEIRAIRKAVGMNGKEFAAAVGVNNATLSRWENAPDNAGQGEVAERDFRDAVWSLLYRRVPAFSIEPGHFRRMNIHARREGDAAPRIVMERVRLKDQIRGVKTDEWDMLDAA